MKKILIYNQTKTEKALKIFDKLGGKCLYVIKNNNFLVGSLTDGDWRRASIRGKTKKQLTRLIRYKNKRTYKKLLNLILLLGSENDNHAWHIGVSIKNINIPISRMNL